MIEISYATAGAFTGFCVGLTGVGGGALMTPILLLIFGVMPTTAIATDLWFAAITKLAGAAVHHDAGKIDWQVVVRLWLGSLPVALIVLLSASYYGVMVKLSWLTQAVGFVVFLTAVGLVFAPKLSTFARERRLHNPAKFKSIQPALTVVAGATLGLCVSLTSVGAGALGTVMLLYLYPLRMTPHRLVATDLVHAIPLAVVAGLGYSFAGLVDFHMLLSLLAGSIPAVIVGSLFAKQVSGNWLRIMLAVLLSLAAWKILISV